MSIEGTLEEHWRNIGGTLEDCWRKLEKLGGRFVEWHVQFVKVPSKHLTGQG